MLEGRSVEKLLGPRGGELNHPLIVYGGLLYQREKVKGRERKEREK